ncbi:MAG: DNA internalization-related competence protein ComEC/Rec2 [Armatimonadetes bacterium]|nr:DNA internalization-related competence protein ComEC/Rec2 [Armatimonadota bacterium]
MSDTPQSYLPRPLLVACLVLVASAATRSLWLVPPLVVVALWRGRLIWLLALAALMGGGRALWVERTWPTHPLYAFADTTCAVVGVVRQPPEPRRAGGERFDLLVQWLRDAQGAWRQPGGVVQVLCPGRAPVVLGDRLRLELRLERPGTAGNPGQYSHRRRLQREGVQLIADLKAPPQVLARRRASALAQVGAVLRARLCAAVHRAMPGHARDAAANLLNGLVFGIYAAPVEAPIEDAFRRVGLSHLLVASGTQVSLLILLVLGLSRVLPLRPSAVMALGLMLVIAYALVTGPEASIVRASVMGVLVLGAMVLGRDYDLLTALAVAAAAQVLWWPPVLGDVGFQLSYVATAGVALIGIPLARRWEPWLGRWLGSVVCFSLGAQLMVAPLMVFQFRKLAWVGLLSNLPALPMAGVLVPSGLLAAAVGTVSPSLAHGLLWVPRWLMDVLVAAVGAMSRWPFGYWEGVVMTPAQAFWVVLGLAGLCLAVAPTEPGRPSVLARLRLRLQAWPRERVLLVGMAVLAAWLCHAAWALGHPRLTVSVLDVGEGDAIVVRSPTGRTMLIDAGPRTVGTGGVTDAGEQRVVPALMLMGVRHLDDIVATHEHRDHIGGLPAVMQAYPRARLWLTPATAAGAAEDAVRLRDRAAATGSETRPLAAGQRIDLGGGALVEVVWPPAEVGKMGVNDTSAVLRVRYGSTALLLAGDLEAAGEQELVASGADLAATVLKVPHQGSATSCTEALLSAVSPKQAAVSVGPNMYGHPAPLTLARLRERGIGVHRTDDEGMITYTSDGSEVRVRTFGRR